MSSDIYSITGPAVVTMLLRAASLDEKWLLTSIETLSDRSAPSLGDLWSLSQKGPFEVSTRELCEALMLAGQVISLDAQLTSDKKVSILIEDGALVIDQQQ